MVSTPGPTSSGNKISGEFSMVELEVRPECLLPPVRVYSPEYEDGKKGLPPLRGCCANTEEENLKKQSTEWQGRDVVYSPVFCLSACM